MFFSLSQSNLFIYYVYTAYKLLTSIFKQLTLNSESCKKTIVLLNYIYKQKIYIKFLNIGINKIYNVNYSKNYYLSKLHYQFNFWRYHGKSAFVVRKFNINVLFALL